MKLTYELNPPKIETAGTANLDSLKNMMYSFQNRAGLLQGLVDGIHLTDSVLGIPRVSGLVAAGLIRENSVMEAIPITCSLRIRDRSPLSISQFVADALVVGIKGILFVAGDDSTHSGKFVIKSSQLVQKLRSTGYDKCIELYLAVPSRMTKNTKIQGKIDAKPDAFITQSIDSLDALKEIVTLSHGYEVKVTACIMIPSEKNEHSAKSIGLNWASYETAPIEFIREASKIADEVLLTSPNSFEAGLDILRQLKT
jgi:5,10-methylenetetrahydrofolate reductase